MVLGFLNLIETNDIWETFELNETVLIEIIFYNEE